MAFGNIRSLGTPLASTASVNFIDFITSNDVQKGELIALYTQYSRNVDSVLVVADNNLNTYGGPAKLFANGANYKTWYAIANALLPAGQNIRFTLPGATGFQKLIFGAVIGGVLASDQIINGGSGTGASFGPTIPPAGNFAAQRNIVIFGITVNTAHTLTEAAGFTPIEGFNLGGTFPIELTYRILSSSAPIAPSFGLSSAAATYNYSAMSFTEAPSNPNMPLMGVG